jgi:hypothetical protein
MISCKIGHVDLPQQIIKTEWKCIHEPPNVKWIQELIEVDSRGDIWKTISQIDIYDRKSFILGGIYD